MEGSVDKMLEGVKVDLTEGDTTDGEGLLVGILLGMVLRDGCVDIYFEGIVVGVLVGVGFMDGILLGRLLRDGCVETNFEGIVVGGFMVGIILGMLL